METGKRDPRKERREKKTYAETNKREKKGRRKEKRREKKTNKRHLKKTDIQPNIKYLKKRMCSIINFLLTLTGYEGEKRGERKEKRKKNTEGRGGERKRKKNIIPTLYAELS